ncbi:kinase-like domain-containing protein [Phaeosphaeria sp. MPI-PUGE-AT-0046c]|nr:kinase-like domain-containing protein [Phaeosphaeria sp. MPI-PUGE-AT-0046c]
MSLVNRAWRPFFGRAWKPLIFHGEGFVPLPADRKVEEESLPDYIASRYYPVRIGDIFRARYQVMGKLGYGATSTIWLARDLRYYVALKLSIDSKSLGTEQDDELEIYKCIEASPKDHPGRGAVRILLDSFDIHGPDGQHRCLVHPPLWETLLDVRHRNPIPRLPSLVIALVLQRLFQALDLLHTACHVAHTDIKEMNILFGADYYVLRAFEQEELSKPSPRKELDGGTIYLSRRLDKPKKIGAPVLCDFGSAVRLDDGMEHREDIQSDVYRAPEIILDIPWTYSVDTWNVGCMIWDAFEGEHLFTGQDPEHETYRGRAHLAEMIALLGPPPASLLARANLRSEFFSADGELCAGIAIPDPTPLEERATCLEGEERVCFLRFMRKMLQWEPEKRSSARELAEDEWILMQSK